MNVYHILLTESGEGSADKAKAKAEEILKEWQDGAADLDSFKALAEKYSEDTVSAVEGGLVGQITKGATVEVFDNWCFDEARKVGDVEIVKTADYGHHLIFFNGESDPIWYVDTKADLHTERVEDWYETQEKAIESKLDLNKGIKGKIGQANSISSYAG